MIEIRLAAAADIPSVALLVAFSFHPGNGWQALWRSFVQLGIEHDLRDRWRSASPHYRCWLAITTTPQPLCVGSVELDLRPINGHPQPYLSNLAVHPDYRRQGIGRKLLSTVTASLAASPYSSLYLHVLAKNNAARQLYRRCGFVVIGEDTTVWGERKLLLSQPLTGDRYCPNAAQENLTVG